MYGPRVERGVVLLLSVPSLLRGGGERVRRPCCSSSSSWRCGVKIWVAKSGAAGLSVSV